MTLTLKVTKYNVYDKNTTYLRKYKVFNLSTMYLI